MVESQTRRHVLITGATGNLGKSLVTQAKTAQWQVTAWSKHGSATDNVRAVSLERWYASAYALKHCEPFDMVVMAHGIQQPATATQYTPELWQYIIEHNLTSCVALTHNLLALNKLRLNALLVYISSIQAQTPRVGRGIYAMAKAALETLTKTVAIELAPDIRTVCLRLGQLQHTMGGIVFSDSEKNELKARAVLPWVDENEVAQLCLDLYKQNSMTGCVVDLSSGQIHNVW